MFTQSPRLIVLLTLTLMALTLPAWAQPANDDIENAAGIPGLPYTDAAPQDRRAHLDLRHVDERPRPQRQRLEGTAVAPVGDLAPGPAVDIVEDRLGHGALGHAAQVLDGRAARRAALLGEAPPGGRGRTAQIGRDLTRDEVEQVIHMTRRTRSSSRSLTRTGEDSLRYVRTD